MREPIPVVAGTSKDRRGAMKTGDHGRKPAFAKKEPEGTYKRIANSLVGTIKKFFVLIFELWKTFPDAVKTTVLISVTGTVVAILWTSDRAPVSQTQQPVITSSTQVHGKGPGPQLQRKTQRSPGMRHQISREGASTQVRAEDLSKQASVREAQQSLERGNYAASYRQFRTILQSLPDQERQRIMAQSQKATRSYERGDFREAAYEMQQAFDSNN
jgi:hypothetical protein